jgi:hypothetical protein
VGLFNCVPMKFQEAKPTRVYTHRFTTTSPSKRTCTHFESQLVTY